MVSIQFHLYAESESEREREMKDPASLGVIYWETSSSPAVVGFLEQDYSYKSIATQIPHNARLAPFRPHGDRSRDHCVPLRYSAEQLDFRYNKILNPSLYFSNNKI